MVEIRKWIFFAVLSFFCVQLLAQSDGQWGVCEFATLSDLNAYDPSGGNWNCKRAFVQATDAHYQWDGSNWMREETISPRIFYPPAIAIDVSSTGTSLTLDLHQAYINQYGTPAIKSAGAPTTVSTYAEDELPAELAAIEVTKPGSRK